MPRLLAILFFCTTAYAQIPDEKLSECIKKGSVYEVSAMLRDRGVHAENAFDHLTDAYPNLPRNFIATAVDNVYFEPAFTNAGGQALAVQIQNLCMYGQVNRRIKPKDYYVQ